jgi:hypothetical protein
MLAKANACCGIAAGPDAVSSTSTPPASVGKPVESALRCIRSARPEPVTCSCCGAACWMSVSA